VSEFNVDGFVHLHNHSSYSLLDGASKIEDIVRIAERDGSGAIATTDHGNVYALIEFYKACNKAGVKPILGTEAYISAGSRFDKKKPARTVLDTNGDQVDVEHKDKLYHHITLLCENNDGYQNLLKISSDAYLNGYFYKPRTDLEFLAEHSKGIIATSGCLGGLVLQPFLQGNYEKGRDVAAQLQDIFGRENFFIEIQDHGIAEQKQTNPMLLKLADELNAPMVLTNDCHYPEHGDHVHHDILLCINTKSMVADTNRFKFHGDQFYIKSPAEMRALAQRSFGEYGLEGCDNTLLIAERCDVKIPLGEIHLPDFPLPTGYEKPIHYLTDLVFDGLRHRFDDINDEIVARVNHELKTINNMGFPGYFLIVWDLYQHAQQDNIRMGPGRGSAAGCLVSYALGISDIDPIKYDLMFERFLNPSRISMPDIDMDMSATGRDNMIDYAKQKYGEDHVAQIITFSQIRSRNAIRDTARVLGHDWQLGDSITKLLPALSMGKEVTLAELFDPELNPSGYSKGVELRDLYSADSDVRTIVDYARRLEGLHRQDGVHAAAVVISDQPLTDLVPVQKKPTTALVTQYDMHAVDELGLLKMDFLGLKTLDIISDAESQLKERGVDVDLSAIREDDPATLELLRSGNSLGVFQLDSGGMQELLRRLAPTSFEDIAAVVALYRPGPMAANMHNDFADRKNRRQPAVPFHPDAAGLLSGTYQLMIYQEQVMAVAQRFAGYSLVEADNLRKIMGKKIGALMKKEQDKFVDGCISQGYSDEFSNSLFDTIAHFSDYAFNKSHAYSYGWISFQTAYLKAHYPLEYMAALCSSASPLSKVSLFVAETVRMGHRVLAPSVNDSRLRFSVHDGAVLIGLASLDGIGEIEANKIVDERSENGRYRTLFDFIKRTNINSGVLETLANAGALDEFGFSRLGVASTAKELCKSIKKSGAKMAGQQSIFDDDDMVVLDVPVREYEVSRLLFEERRATGAYLSGHPLEGYVITTTDTVADLLDADFGVVKNISVVVSNLELKTTKLGKRMAKFQLSDATGTVDCVLFSNQFKEIGHHLHDGAGVKASVVGLDDKFYDRKNFVVNTLFALEKSEQDTPSEDEVFKLYLPKSFNNYPEYGMKLKSVLLNHPGNTPVVLYVSRSSTTKGANITVQVSDGLNAEIGALFREFAGRKG
jgi:DNA polymerase III subunit alpha